MTDEERKGSMAVERSLHKAFKSVQLFSSPLVEMLADTLPLVSSMATFLDTIECATRQDFSAVPFAADYPDLQARLLHKLNLQLCERIDELKEKIQPLKQKHDELSKYCETCRSLLLKYSHCLSLADLAEGRDSSPSLALMMDWLEKISASLLQQYNYKSRLLEMAASDEGSVKSENFLSLWKENDDELVHTVKGSLLRVQYFLHKKL